MSRQSRPIAVSTISFELPGALIDRSRGVVDWCRAWLRQHGRRLDDDTILATYEATEQRLRHQHPAAPFTALLPYVHDALAREWELDSDQSAALDLLDSVRDWPAFTDALHGWRALGERYRLVAAAAVDRWAVEQMSRTLGDPFDLLLPAEAFTAAPRESAYWTELLAHLHSHPGQVLHCAADPSALAAAAQAGLATAWLDRQGARNTAAEPPDFHIGRLGELVAALRWPAA